MNQTKALQDVIAERERQKSVEGRTEEHDDKHKYAELAEAAACYADLTARQIRFGHLYDQSEPPDEWPFDEDWWNPKDPRRNLVRAGALILAEIERLDRATPAKEGE